MRAGASKYFQKRYKKGVVGDCCILRMYRFSVNTSKSLSRGEFPPLVKGLIFLPSNYPQLINLQIFPNFSLVDISVKGNMVIVSK